MVCNSCAVPLRQHLNSLPSKYYSSSTLLDCSDYENWYFQVDQPMVKVYTCVIHPIVEYCSVLCHSQLTDEQDEIVKRLSSSCYFVR